MRTLFTLYKVKREFPGLHTVVEVIDPTRMAMVKANLRADEIILKEIIDGNLIARCIRTPGISSLIYELINLEGKVIQETNLDELGIADASAYRDVILHGIENDKTFIGFIRGKENLSQLSPAKATVIRNDDRLIYIADRKARR
jgi:Trk K+ transport system NAD-binding subunit